MERRMKTPLKILVVGCGNMGSSHAKAYHADPGFELAGVVDQRRAPAPRAGGRPRRSPGVRRLRARAGRHEAGLCRHLHLPRHARRLDAARVRRRLPRLRREADRDHGRGRRAVVAEATRAGRKLVVGYILRHHPVVAQVHRAGPDARQAAGDADEPEPAERRARSGTRTRTSCSRCRRSSTAACTTST